MSGTIVPLIWQTYKMGVEKKDVWRSLDENWFSKNFVTVVVLSSVSTTPYWIARTNFSPKSGIHFWTNIFQEMKYFILFEPQS